MSLINCKNLSLSYDSTPVIQNVSFTLEPGSYFCIVGENGSGKSTLVKALLGLKKPLSGSIEFGEGLRQNQIGFLPQYSSIQKDFPASVKEVVLSGCLNNCPFLPFYKKDQIKRAEAAMELLGVTEYKNKSFQSLSGGQKQRVLLSRALCATDKLLLLDEPVNGLDPVVTEEFYRILEELNAKGIAIIMVSHDIRSVAKYASHVLHLGSTEWFFGNIEEYKNSDLGHSFLCDHSHCEHEHDHSAEHLYSEEEEA